MSYIPDCRTNEFYNTNKLGKSGKSFVLGFDVAVESIDTAFDNLDTISDFVEEMPDDLSPSDIRSAGKLFRKFLLTWMEMERNNNIVSMIDADIR